MIIMIALKGAIRYFSPTGKLKWSERNYVQIMHNTPSTRHVQHVCHVVRRDSSAIMFDKVGIAFISYWLKQLTSEGSRV